MALQAKNHERHQVKQEFVGLSTDTKPTLAESLAGSTLYETDTRESYIWTGTVWRKHIITSAITFGDNASVDAFSRQRVSEPVTVFEAKHIHTDLDDRFDYVVTAGGSYAFVPEASSVDLTVDTTLGASVLKQSRQYIPYSPGKSQFIVSTGHFAAGKTNLYQEWGYGDGNDGILLTMTGTDVAVLLRTSTSGAVDNTNSVAQSNWNLDPLDGTGASGIVLDSTKQNIPTIDLQWLGSGRARVGFDIDGSIVYCHEFVNANKLTAPYMSTGSLPVRQYIVNTGVTTSPSTFRTTCVSVMSEGGFRQAGESFEISNETTVRNVGSTRSPVLAIRPVATINGKVNRSSFRLTSVDGFTINKNCYFEVVHAHGVTGITGTWTPVGTDSGLEASYDVTAVATSTEHPFMSFYAAAGGKGRAKFSGGGGGTLDIADEHVLITLNSAGAQDVIFVVYATSFTSTTDVTVSSIISVQE